MDMDLEWYGQKHRSHSKTYKLEGTMRKLLLLVGLSLAGSCSPLTPAPKRPVVGAVLRGDAQRGVPWRR